MNVRWIGALSFIGLASCQDGATSTLPTALDRSPAPTAISQGGPRPGYHIVVFRADVTDAPGLARALVSAHAGTLEHTYEHAILGFSAALSDGAVAAIRRHPEVALVEQDSWVTASITQTSATWGIDRTDQRALPLDQQYTYTATGNGVNAYIIDTGIRTTHVDFGGRASAVFDAIGDGNGAVDCNGHGTHVAGTVGSATYGIAKQVRLYSVRVLNCAGSGSTSGVIAGVDWVTANHLSPAVANMSLGGGISTTLDQAVRNSVTSGVTYVVAAGNDNLDACGGSPSRVAEAITVGSTTTTDARSSFSNVGTCLDLFAPGSSITSTYGGSDVQTAILSGTSMASPHVAGAAARYLEINPAASGATVASALVGNATTGVVTSAGTGSPNRLLYTSFIDGPPVNQAPVAQFTSSCTGLTCTFNSSASSDDVGITSRSWAFGDGATAGNVVSPSRTYAASGTYTVTLTVTDAGGLTGTRAAAVTVTSANTTPVAAFNVSCVNLTCTFDSSVSTDDVGITARQWFFGDGGSAGSVVSPSRTYAAAGTYSVRLNVLDGGGLWSSLTKPVTVSAGVNQPPVAQFTVTCVLLTCSFDSSGSTDDVGIVSRGWTFGDGATAGHVVATSRTYSAAGTYTVVLTVRDGPGLTATRTQAVTVTAPPPTRHRSPASPSAALSLVAASIPVGRRTMLASSRATGPSGMEAPRAVRSWPPAPTVGPEPTR